MRYRLDTTMAGELRSTMFGVIHVSDDQKSAAKQVELTRTHVAMLTDHELLLLALVRALDANRQREIGGVLYRLASNNVVAARFRDEGASLGVEHLEASVLKPFIEASRDAGPIALKEVA